MKEIDYPKILKRSWYLTWKNKWLWVMGLVLAIFGAGSSSGGGSGRSMNSISATPTPQPIYDQINVQSPDVLGEVSNMLSNWFSNISIYSWVLSITAILFFILFTVVVSWIITSWAKGALIWGLHEADKDVDVNLVGVSPKGISKIRDLLVFRLISLGLTILTVLVLLVVVGLGFLVKVFFPLLGMILLVLLGLAGLLCFIVAMILIIMLNIYAERLIVLKNISPWQAWREGLSLARKNFVTTICMGLINSALGCGFGCGSLVILLLVFGPFVYLTIYPVLKNGIESINLTQISVLVIILILFFSVNTLFRAVFVVFNYGNWNLLFKEIFSEK